MVANNITIPSAMWQQKKSEDLDLRCREVEEAREMAAAKVFGRFLLKN